MGRPNDPNALQCGLYKRNKLEVSDEEKMALAPLLHPQVNFHVIGLSPAESVC